MKQICAKCWLTMYPEEVRLVDDKIVCSQCEKILLARKNMEEGKDE